MEKNIKVKISVGSHHLLLWFCKEGKRQDGKTAKRQLPSCHLAVLPLCHSRYKQSIR
jgi:hypothetical protein